MRITVLLTVTAVLMCGCGSASGPVVDRGFVGCPSGYVAHPTNPKQCVLPAIAARYYARFAPQPENPYREYQTQAQPLVIPPADTTDYQLRVMHDDQVNADLAARRAADEARNRQP